MNRRYQARAKRKAGSFFGVPPIAREVLRSPGRRLDAPTRGFMEPRFGHDFSRVRVHADDRAAAAAQAVNAQAYTVGQHVVFGKGRFQPRTPHGDRLLAHELAHTIQQGATVSGLPSRFEAGGPRDAAENEAETAAASVMRGQPARVAGGLPPFARQADDEHPPAVNTATLPAVPAAADTLAAGGAAPAVGQADTTATPAAAQCPVAAIAPITDADALQMENGTRVIWNNTAAGLQPAATSLQAAVVAEGGTAVFQSAYRPQAYQTHLREVWDKARALRNNNSAACAAVKAAVTAEMDNHALAVDRPVGRVSNHSDGSAFDMSWNLPNAANPGQRIDALARAAGLHRPVANDPIHFTLR